jgi:hypothetical protein
VEEVDDMTTRFIVAAIVAGSVAAAAAQDPPSRPDQKAGQAQTQTVTVTGCLQAASTAGQMAQAQQTQGSSAQYILAQAKLTSDPTATTGTAGTTGLTTADKFRLIGGKPTEMKEHLNHRVEITGTLQPRSERGQAKGEATPQKPSTEGDLPTLRVTGFKHLAATCGPEAL